MEGASFSSFPFCLSLGAEQMRWHADCVVWIEILKLHPRDRMKRDISHRSLSEHGQMAKNTTVFPGRVGKGQSFRGGGGKEQGSHKGNSSSSGSHPTSTHDPSAAGGGVRASPPGGQLRHLSYGGLRAQVWN